MTKPNPLDQDQIHLQIPVDEPNTPPQTNVPTTQDVELPKFLQNLQQNIGRPMPTFAPTPLPISINKTTTAVTYIAQQFIFTDEDQNPELTAADTTSTEATGDHVDNSANPQAKSSDGSTYVNTVIDNRLLSLMIDIQFIADFRELLGLSTIVLEQEHHSSLFEEANKNFNDIGKQVDGMKHRLNDDAWRIAELTNWKDVHSQTYT